jgi:gamma-glutamyl hercynylcysteine S-oxide synthase
MPPLQPASHKPPPSEVAPQTTSRFTPPCMTIVPSGPAQIGYDAGFPDEAPAHRVDVPIFAIGVYPVTNRDYAAFLLDADMPSPCYWQDARFNQYDQPIVGVTWGAAQAYCRWLTSRLQGMGLLPADQVVRLPTELEWEKAASWNPVIEAAWRYPWGEQWDDARAITAATGTRFPLPVAQTLRGASAYGVHGMLGNVWEWTASLYMSYPGAAQAFTEPNHYVIRGGSCSLRPTHLRCSYRCRLPPDAWRYHLGFRIVVAAPLD